MNIKTIYLIRHGETEANRLGIFRGRLDIPLSQVGVEQAGALAGYFKDLGIEKVFSSPLSRALETARIAFAGKTPQIEELINNIDLGDWSGKEKGLIKEKEGEAWEKWMKCPEKMAFPGGGETLVQVYRRAEKFLDTLIEDDSVRIAAVTHRSVAKVILAVAMGKTEDYFWKFHLDNASVSIIYFAPDRGFTLAKLNHTDHLANTVMEWY